MARPTNRLTARTVETLKKPGKHADGQGLYLIIDQALARRWGFIFRSGGRSRFMGLGKAADVTLAEARDLAHEARRAVQAGRDPIEDRKAAREAKKIEQDRAITFGVFADELLKTLAPGFRSDKHRSQWQLTLTRYAAPLRSKTLDSITTEDVLKLLTPMWSTKPQTATRVRGRIERVLDAAKAKKLRSGDNPAAWRGNLKELLPKAKKLSRGHHPAMAYDKIDENGNYVAEIVAVSEFVGMLRDLGTVPALMLEFLILTVGRCGEVLGAIWDEIDLNAKVWTVPAARMKAGKLHRVPLSDRALAILEEASKLRGPRTGDYVFPGERRGRPLSPSMPNNIIRSLGVTGATAHGFRSTFRDWCGNETATPREIAEAALAHATGDQTERAYRRGDALEKRRELMAAWATYVDSDATDSNVVPMARAAP
ncbi:Integrase [Rhizobiales bacterium GAS188]|nr:Integrase [Rhizobiales bacterium GAS188]